MRPGIKYMISNPCKNNILWASNHLAQPAQVRPIPPKHATSRKCLVSSVQGRVHPQCHPWVQVAYNSSCKGCMQSIADTRHRHGRPPVLSPLPRGLSERARSTNPLCSLGLRLYLGSTTPPSIPFYSGSGSVRRRLPSTFVSRPSCLRKVRASAGRMVRASEA